MADDARFSEAIHAPNRLRICGLLRPVDSAEFSVLKDTLGLSEANLSKTVRSLVELGFVTAKKSTSSSRTDRRLTTTLSLTPLGQYTFDAHIVALQRLAAEALGDQ